MKSRQVRGTFAEQKQRHRAKQRFFNAVMRAARLTRKGASVAVQVHGVPVRTVPNTPDPTHAVISVRRGYALVRFTGDSRARAVVLAGLGAETIPEGLALDAGRILFACVPA